MTAAEQQRRRALKRERRDLDRRAQADASQGKRYFHPPSTRSKQAKWHHEVASAQAQARAQYEQTRDRIRAIAAELARTDADRAADECPF